MNGKKKLLVFLPLLILVLAGIALGAFRLSGRMQDQSRQMDALYQENEQLRDQVQKLQEQLDIFMTVSSLSSWDLQADPWPNSTGADVTFTAVPTEYVPGMGATLLVMLGERQAASIPCVWDGTRFTGTASLDAADGYSYFCLLSGPSGMQQLNLMNPDSEKAEIPVYLHAALSSYCNLVINDWAEQHGALVLNSAYAQVQLPQIEAEELTITDQELVLRLNGQIHAKVPTLLTPSEVSGSYEMLISDLHLPMPTLKRGDILELSLEVSLSDGRHLQGFGISWCLENGKLSSAVG